MMKGDFCEDTSVRTEPFMYPVAQSVRRFDSNVVIMLLSLRCHHI